MIEGLKNLLNLSLLNHSSTFFLFGVILGNYPKIHYLLYNFMDDTARKNVIFWKVTFQTHANHYADWRGENT